MVSPVSLHLLSTATEHESLRSFGASPELWLAFSVGVIALLLLDLLVLHRSAHEISLHEATITSIGWISVGLAFGLIVWWALGSTAAAQYYAGYIVEKSLSVDNVFVWAVIFGYLAVPSKYQHRVLFWGIFGAIVLRVMFVVGGVALLERLEWVLFIFGGFLIFTAIRMVGEHEFHPENNPALRLLRRMIPVTKDLHGQQLFTRENGRRAATPLFAALVLVEATDVVFAVDSVPAVLAISRDPFVIISSNVLAILGLRALYFLLASARERLTYLDEGLAVILGFVGIKMIVSRIYHIPALPSLGFIALVLVITIVASFRATRDDAGG